MESTLPVATSESAAPAAEAVLNLAAQADLEAEKNAAYADLLSQAITGELVGMENFAAIACISDDPVAKMEAIEHAYSERGHAMAFMRTAEKLNLQVKVDMNARYWKRLRASFQKYIAERDFTACYLAQEVMLESLAVSMYRKVGQTVEGPVGEVFRKVAKDEEEHLSHYLEELREKLKADPEGFQDKVYSVHKEVMTTIALMIAKEDPAGHCGLCNGGCVKKKMGSINLSISTLRGGSLELYLSMLDEIGLPGNKTLQWMCELPS